MRHVVKNQKLKKMNLAVEGEELLAYAVKDDVATG